MVKQQRPLERTDGIPIYNEEYTDSKVKKLIATLALGKDIFDVSQRIVNHESQDSHHGGTAVVELDGSL